MRQRNVYAFLSIATVVDPGSLLKFYQKLQMLMMPQETTDSLETWKTIRLVGILVQYAEHVIFAGFQLADIYLV